MSDRPETGPMQFGEDWPGLFIRGDNCFYYAIHLEELLKSIPDDAPVGLNILILQGLLQELQSSRVPVKNVQQLKLFEECK